MRSLLNGSIEDYALHGTWSRSLQGAKTSVEPTELSLSTKSTENPEILNLLIFLNNLNLLNRLNLPTSLNPPKILGLLKL
jgi:hypothetical protein